MTSLCRVGLLMLVLAPAAAAQSLPALKNVSFMAAVSRSGDVFTYSYRITNPSTSLGRVWTISVDITQAPNAASASADGLVNGPGFLTGTAEAVASLTETIPMIPVGGECPSGWLCSIAVNGRAVFGAAEQAALVQPGGTLSGFVLTSHGLPGIRTVVVEPFFDLAQLPITPPVDDADLARYDRERAALEASLRFNGSTIGPTAPPAGFKFTDFLQTIIGYKERAIQLGWIKDQGIGISLDAKLNAAQAALTRGDDKTAANVLKALLNEVDAQAGRQLAPEAVALLKFNTQYLLSKLP
jgi:hypothetical protein